MERERWEKIEDLLQQALDVEPPERDAFLDSVCSIDDELRRDVRRLLANEDAGAFLSRPPFRREPVQLIGSTISHYRIDRLIGAGGMAEVFEAYDEQLRRTVAVKVLSAALGATSERARFEQEALAASRLNHPNIITIFEVVRHEGADFIVAERVEGQTLRHLLNGSGQLDVEATLDIAVQIARALQAAHTAWIIHRDIKPENVMVRADGLVKVLDFGIAKLSEERSGSAIQGRAAFGPVSDLTVPGAIVGTTTYMSPEQARGEPLDGRTDIYSLGLVTYEMAASRRYASPADLDRVRRDLRPVLRKMLAPDRNDRYSTTVELLADIEQLQRRIKSRTARRIAFGGLFGIAAAVCAVGIAAVLSMSESWEEPILRDGHSAAARQVIISPDGGRLVSCGEDGRIIIWDFGRRERIATIEGANARKLAFAPDGTWFASGTADGSVVIRDAHAGSILRVLRGHSGEVGAVAVSHHGSFLATAALDGITVRRTSDWETVRHWPEAVSYGSVAFSADDTQLISSTAFATYLVDRDRSWRMEEGQANALVLSPDSREVATIDTFGRVSFYAVDAPPDLRRRHLIAQRAAHQDHGRAVVWSPDGRFLASGADDIVLWDAASREKIARFEPPAIVWSLAFSPDGRWLISSHADGAVLIWDIAERECAGNLSGHAGPVRGIAFAADGNHLASAGDDRSVVLWSVMPPRKRAVLRGHSTRVTSVSFGNTAASLASIDHLGTALVWDVAARSARAAFRPPPANPTGYTCDLARRGDLLLTSHGIYHSRGGPPVISFSERNSKPWPYGQVYGSRFFADGRRAAVVTTGGWLLLWDVRAKQLAAKARVPNTHIITVDVSADSQWLTTGEDEGRIRLWSVDPLREVAVIGRHAARVKAVAFSPDASIVASAGDDKMLALWDVRARKLRMQIGTHASPIYAIAFSPDGTRLASGEHDGSVRVYRRRRTLWGVEY